jgi:photosystem II CP47 chlorophyll apoprotein
MITYELIIVDPSDPLFNPIWRQGLYTVEFASRIGVISSVFNWSLGIDFLNSYSSGSWSYESVSAAHLVLSGLLILSSLWHWSFWDLDVFLDSTLGSLLVIDYNKVFGIHLLLSGILCLGYGYCHVTGLFGPGIWSTDTYALIGTVRSVKPVFSLVSITAYRYGVISAHHIIAGILGIVVSVFHIASRPQALLFRLLNMGTIETVLSSSIIVVGFAGIVNASLLWYGGVVTPIELFGPTRYHWDNSFFSQELERRVKSSPRTATSNAWAVVNDKLLLYDYIGNNPAKGGLFRSGPIVKGDGYLQNWLGHAFFTIGTLPITVRRLPPFFESFPLLLIDQRGRLRSDIPFRRAQSSYSIEQTSNLNVRFLGGILDCRDYSRSTIIKGYALKAQYGEIFTFDKVAANSDGVFRTSPRGWFSFSHVTLSLIFFFGHLWHAGRALYKDLSAGITISGVTTIGEYGSNERLGDSSTSTLGYL